MGNKTKISIEGFDPHWYRRVFHTASACFLIYYLLPDVEVLNFLKNFSIISIFFVIIFLEFFRLKGKISSSHFFGLRVYEENRVGSYFYFCLGVLILLLFFPQQIAIPCILCASIGDPLLGEFRKSFGKKIGFVLGFLVCVFFFAICWSFADFLLALIVSFVGGFCAVVGESVKFWWIDDDFMIQIFPAVLLLIIWFLIPMLGFGYPDLFIYPINLF